MLCYWILYLKGKVLSCNTVKSLNSDNPKKSNIQEWIRNYLGLTESVLGGDDFGTSLYGYYVFINDYEEYITKDDPIEEIYQGIHDYIELYDFIYNNNEKKAANSYV